MGYMYGNKCDTLMLWERMKSLTLLFQDYDKLPLMNIFCSIQT